ncbi:MAG: DUF3426 domain-containing protein [Pseudomonadota bacterium]
MIIACPTCSTRYDIPADALGANGRKVKCAQCGNSWLATAEEPLSEPTASSNDAFDDTSFDEQGPVETNSEHAEDDFNADVISEDIVDDFDELDMPDLQAGVSPKPANKRIVVKRRKRKPLPWTKIGAVAACAAFFYAAVEYRVAVVKLAPQLADAYAFFGLPVNVRGLSFADLSFRFGAENGARMLYVSGMVENLTNELKLLPDLQLTLRDDTGTPLASVSRTLSQTEVDPGGTTPFQVRMANPPEPAVTVTMRFIDREQASLVTGVGAQ